MTMFPNLGDPPFYRENRFLALEELREAGVPRGCSTYTAQEKEVFVPGSKVEQMTDRGIYIPSLVARSSRQWLTGYTVEAKAFGWHFRRAWYYWVCSTTYQPVLLVDAEKLHKLHGQEVRVDGSCGCPQPSGSVTNYHVDSREGFAALIGILREQHEQR